MNPFRPSVHPTAVLLFAACFARADLPGSAGRETLLLEARAPEGSVVAFVPSGRVNGKFLIETRENAAAWRKWAETSHPGKSVALRWDSEPFDLEVSDGELLAWVREGDEAVDPAGRFRYAVASDPVPASRTVQLRLLDPPPARDFAPDCCASNVWLLSRDTLFARWKERAERGGAADVRRALRALERSSRFDALPGWRAAADAFRAETPGMVAVVRFRNAKESPVRVRIGGKTETVAGGTSWAWSPDPTDRPASVSWEARDVGDGRSSDDDWTWSPKTEIAGFDPAGEDGEVVLAGPFGSLKPLPFLAFPADVLPGGADRAELRYADGGRETVPVVTRNGRPAVECEPGRAVRRCVVRVDGWKDGVFEPEGGIAPVARDESLALSGAPMERNLPPWKDGAVRIVWNGFEGDVRLRVAVGTDAIDDRTIPPGTERVRIPLSERLGDAPVSETNVVVSWWSGDERLGGTTGTVRRGATPDECAVVLTAPAPKVPWPETGRVEAAKQWFSKDRVGKEHSQLYYLRLDQKAYKPPDTKRKQLEARKELFRLLGFRPDAEAVRPEWRAFEKTFDEMVAHAESCRGCPAHRNGLSAPAAALAALLPDEETRLVESLTAWPDPKNFPSVLKSWWRDCAHALEKRYDLQVDSKKSLNEAKERWNGGGKTQGTSFAEAYVHIVCCNGCAHCRPFRAAMLGEKTFENRRTALFRALMLSEKKSPKEKEDRTRGADLRPTDADIERILEEFAHTGKENAR